MMTTDHNPPPPVADLTSPARERRIDPPVTGDEAIDAALSTLAELPADDVDGHLERGEEVLSVLRARLSDVGG